MELILVLLAVALQAFFAGGETSLVRANWIRVFSWASEGRRWAPQAKKLLARREMVLIATLVGTNAAVVAASTLVERFVSRTLGAQFSALSVLGLTAVTLFLAEFLPKSLAQVWPERMLCLGGPGLRVADRVFLPLTWLLGRLAGVRPEAETRYTLSRHDFLFALRDRAATPSGRRLSGIAARLLDFPSVVVKDVMTPMARVVLVAEGASETEVRRLVREHRFSRYPVFRDRPDNIVGVLHFRDMLQPCAGRYRRPLFVAPAARALAVMDRMKQEGEHFAMVREEGGPILGIVTLEDLLEELVGEIRSEE